MSTLHDLPLGKSGTIHQVRGERSFRRRLLELGLTPGAQVEVLGRAPLGDPIELLVRGYQLSIRIHEALLIDVTENAPLTEDQ